MLIRAGFSLRFETEQPTPMLALLSVHPSRSQDILTRHRIDAENDLPISTYVDSYGNLCSRLTIPAGGTTLSTDFVISDSGLVDPRAPEGPQMTLEELPSDVLIFLLGSRYCDTDRLLDFAWQEFGELTSARDRVEDIVAFTHGRIRYSYEHARPDKSAFHAFDEQRGVCRDYAHLAISLCRCMNIPARYCTGYLGDIGVPPDDIAIDFHAWIEVFISGAWYTYDPRHGVPRTGRILMARGRDAADTALTTTFGPNELVEFKVHTEEVDTVPSFLP
jgi:transglutaminase-like putative cysteine protease